MIIYGFNRFSEPCNNRKLNAWNHTSVVIVRGQYNKQRFSHSCSLFDLMNKLRVEKTEASKTILFRSLVVK